MSDRPRFRPRLLPLAPAALLFGALSCASSSTLQFRCDNPINGGLLLTVDIVRADDAQARQIEALGEKWFYDPLRDTLRDRTTTAVIRPRPASSSASDSARSAGTMSPASPSSSRSAS